LDRSAYTIRHVTDPAMSAIMRRAREQIDETTERAVERYRSEIADYAASARTLIDGEVLTVTRRAYAMLCDRLENDSPPSADMLDEMRRAFARRVNQAVSLPSIHQACQIGSETFWEAILASASLDVPAEREAALRAAGTVLSHLSLVATIASQAYLDAVEDVQADRHIVRRHLLDALLAGRAAAPATVRDARLLGIDLHPDYVVVVARTLCAEADDVDERRAGNHRLRQAAGLLRERLRSDADRPLVGLREGEVVCLYPAASPASLDQVKQLVRPLAAPLTDLGVSVGIGSWHALPAGVPTSYSEAREAAEIALRSGMSERVVVFDDVLIDHVLRSNPHAARIIENALGPLRDYDERRNTALVETLRTYLNTGLSVTRSANALSVHANTVVYRLDRIRELTGRDPRETGDLVFLALSLRLDAEPAL
jgi:sugar diacid utilization regulator